MIERRWRLCTNSFLEASLIENLNFKCCFEGVCAATRTERLLWDFFLFFIMCAFVGIALLQRLSVNGIFVILIQYIFLIKIRQLWYFKLV
jgi:hypothetical protein